MWKIISYIKKGISHSVNQDAISVLGMKENNGVTIGVLADGLGGLKGQGGKTKSEIASNAVVKKVSEIVSLHFDDLIKEPDKRIEFAQKMILCCKDMINERIIEHNAKYNSQVAITDMDCTLLFVAVKDNKAIMCHIDNRVIIIIA